MADENEMFLENLDEFINDEDKIVTYKWLSRTLSVPVNNAKQMLYAFAQKQKASQTAPLLSITYIVGGQCCVEGEMVHRFVIASDEKLQETKKKFSPVTSLHIYSIQKARLKDYNALYSVDYDIQQQHKSEQNRWSHIYCPAAENLRDTSVPVDTDRKTSLTNGAHRPSSGKMVNGVNHVGSTSHVSSGSSLMGKQQKSKVKKGQMSALEMFSAKPSSSKTDKKGHENKSNSASTEVRNKESAVGHKKMENNKPGGTGSFFGKTISGKKPSEKQSTEGKDNETCPVKTEGNEGQNQYQISIGRKKRGLPSEDEEEPLPKELSKGVKLDSDEGTKSKENKKKRKEDNEETKPSKINRTGKKKAVNSESDNEKEQKPRKRRKRMKELPEEESSDEESVIVDSEKDRKSPELGSSRSESPLPRQQPVQQPSKETTRRRKRKRELRSKTYMNEDGFMVTEKVWESESTDASEDEPLPAKPAVEKPPSPGKKSTKTQALNKAITKQASLRNFFKKS